MLGRPDRGTVVPRRTADHSPGVALDAIALFGWIVVLILVAGGYILSGWWWGGM
ncbi:hypothetical protein ACFWZW_08690 [Microbacterium enclense]|uniref:hypothetical protein n=1 Tax=Microbacterium enclense TaxID=993073 RepID=UPI0036DA0829